MLIGTIIGSATSTVKHPALTGWRLAVVQPLGARGQPDGDPQVAIDPLNAGVGQRVIINSDGRYIREIVKQEKCPARFIVCAVVND
jgi:ethanolamine utilization protein EutN